MTNPENKSIHFLNLSNRNNIFTNVSSTVVSPLLNYICIISKQKDAFLYFLPDCEANFKPFWQSSAKVQRCLFSENGKYILVILNVNSLQIFSINEENLSLLVQVKASVLANFLKNHEIDFSAASLMDPVQFKNQEVIITINKSLILNIEWNTKTAPSVKYSISLNSSLELCVNSSFIFMLKKNNTVDVFSTLTGKKKMDIIFSQLHQHYNFSSFSKDIFFKISVHSDSKVLAAVNQNEDILLFDIQELFRDEKNMATEIHKKKAKWLWSYKNMKMNNDLKIPSYRLLGKVSSPSGLVVSYLQFSLKGLFIFFSVLGHSKNKCFKVIEENTGEVLFNFDDLEEFNIVIGGPFPLIMTDSILSICLGQLCNDYFFTLLCEFLPNFTLSKESKRTFLSQLSQDISDLHVVLLKIILHMHLNIFYCSVKSLPVKKSDKISEQCMTKVSFLEKKIIKKINELFTIVLEYKESDDSLLNVKQSMLVSCFLHAVHLLDIIQVKNKKYLSSQIFSQLLKHILILYNSIDFVDPLKAKWEAWINMTDKEIIEEALIVNAVALAHVYFVTNRKWSVDTAEDDFKTQALAWIVNLIATNQFEKAKIALDNLGYQPIHYLKTLCLNSNNSDLRDLLVCHFQKINDFSEEENEAWIFCKKIESALTSTYRHYYMFEQEMNVSSKFISKLNFFKFGSFDGSIDVITIMKLPKEWREYVLTEVYFNTSDTTLEKLLNKELCWKYLIESNQINLLKKWVDITCNIDTFDSLTVTSDFFARNFYSLFAQNCNISEKMLNFIYDLNCTTTTKNTILDISAFYGVFSTLEKNCLKAIISRLENISALSHIRTILSKPFSNVSLYNFDRMIFIKCLNSSLKPLILICLNDTTFFNDFTEVRIWVNTWNMFNTLNSTRIHMINFAECIRKSAEIYKSSAEEGSLIDVAVAILEKTEISDVILKKEKKFTLLSLPLLENYSKIIEITNERKPDVTFYDLLNCSNVPVNKLFLWQSKNSNIQTYSQEFFFEFPHFNHQILNSQFGFRQNLEYSYYLKQSRPSFACNLFIVESLRSHRRLTTKMIKRACGVAHGLALKYWEDASVGSACIAFVAMLGDIGSANMLRMHLAAIEFTKNYLEKSENFYISTLLRGIISKDFFYIQEMAYILESFVMTHMNEKKSLLTLEKWYQVVFFCNSQNLPLPCSLLKYLAQNHDWFFFLTYLDVFKYSYEQAVELIEEIDSKILKSHLIRALTRTTLKLSTTSPNKSPPKILLEPGNNVQEDCETAILKDNKDIFHCFVSNVYTEVLNTIQTFTDKNLVLPWSCEQDPDYDVLLTLLKCESEPDTSKSLIISSIELQSPVLAILATCFQTENLFLNFIAWIISSMPVTTTRIKRKEEGLKLVEHPFSSKEIENLFNNYFSIEHFQTFSRGMKLFMAENPLSIFLEVIYNSIILLDFENSFALLKKFIVEITHFTTKEQTVFFSKNWILKIVAFCIESLLKRSELKIFVKKQFLRMLAESDLAAVDSGFPNYLLWFQICEILETSDTNLDFIQFYDISVVSDELQNCIDNLLNNFQFSQTLELCSLLGINKDKCILAMWEYQLDLSIKAGKNLEKIWADSSLAFKDENVNPNLAAFFYLKMVSRFKSSLGESLKNRFLALDYCLYWRKLIEDTLSPSFKEESDSIELEKWMCCLEPAFDFNFLKNSSINDATHSLLINVWSSSKVLIRCQSLNDYQRARVEDLINLFLDQEDLQKALKLSAFFKSTNQDLIIISSCLKFSHGELNITDLSKVSSTVSFELQKLSHDHYIGNYLQLPGYKTSPSKEQQQTLYILDKLSRIVKHGKSLATKILVSFRLSVNLDSTFKDIASERDYLCFLSRCIASENVNKFSVVSDLIKLADLKSRDLAIFLKDKIVSAVVDFQLTDLIMPVKLWDVLLTSDFHLIINLLDDASLLGLELLQASINLPYKLGIEILIRAHDCFTASCNVEGIGKILRRARVLAAQALKEEQWQYLMKLLIGIQRYGDMVYVFEMLKDNNQIEKLLSKGMHKSLSLQIAISEFLHRQCPQNRQMSKMVAAHFGLHFKLAALWQEEADEIILKLPVVNNILKDSNKTRNALNTALDNYSHAVHWYIQAGKLNKALKLAHLAQLVALQISLIGGPFILKIHSQSELQILLNESLSVGQTILICRACDIEPDWSTALHKRWILKGDKAFYVDLKSSNILTHEVLQIYCMRYKHELITNNKAKERLNQMTSTYIQNSPLEKDLKRN